MVEVTTTLRAVKERVMIEWHTRVLHVVVVDWVSVHVCMCYCIFITKLCYCCTTFIPQYNSYFLSSYFRQYKTLGFQH